MESRWYTGSELGCHSHRFLRRPRQSSRALSVWVATTRPADVSCASWGSFTHTHHSGTCTTASGLVCTVTNRSTLTEQPPQLLQRVRRATTHIRRCWCRRDAKHTRGTRLAVGGIGCRGAIGSCGGSAHLPAVKLGAVGVDDARGRWTRREVLPRLYEDIDRCATLDCQGAVRGCVWAV